MSAEVTAISKENYECLSGPQLTFTLRFCMDCKITPSQVVGQPIDLDVASALNIADLPAITALHLAVRFDSSAGDASKIQNRFPTIFQGFGDSGEEYEIQLKTDAKLFVLFFPRHVPLPLHSKLKKDYKGWYRWESYPKWISLYHGAQEWWLC